jgi:hypothetical protein
MRSNVAHGRIHGLLTRTEIPEALPCLDPETCRKTAETLRFIALARRLEPGVRVRLVDSDGQPLGKEADRIIKTTKKAQKPKRYHPTLKRRLLSRR